MGQKESINCAPVEYAVAKAGLVAGGVSQGGAQQRYPALLYSKDVWQGREVPLNFGNERIRIMDETVVIDPHVDVRQHKQRWHFNSLRVVPPTTVRFTSVLQLAKTQQQQSAMVLLPTDLINLDQYINSNNRLSQALGLTNSDAVETAIFIDIPKQC